MLRVLKYIRMEVEEAPLALPERLGRVLALDSKPGRLPVVGRLVREERPAGLGGLLEGISSGTNTRGAARGPELVFSRFDSS